MKIDNTKSLNSAIIHDFVQVRYSTCKIDIDLIWNVIVNMILISQKDPDEVFDIELNYEDINFANTTKINRMFMRHKKVGKMTMTNVFDVDYCDTIFKNVNFILLIL